MISSDHDVKSSVDDADYDGDGSDDGGNSGAGSANESGEGDDDNDDADDDEDESGKHRGNANHNPTTRRAVMEIYKTPANTIAIAMFLTGKLNPVTMLLYLAITPTHLPRRSRQQSNGPDMVEKGFAFLAPKLELCMS